MVIIISAAKYTELKNTARGCKEYCLRSERQHQRLTIFLPSFPQPPSVKDRILLHAVEEIACWIICGVSWTEGHASPGFLVMHATTCFLMHCGGAAASACWLWDCSLSMFSWMTLAKVFFWSYKGKKKLQWSEVHVSAECEFCETEVNFCILEALALPTSDSHVCYIPEKNVSISKKTCNDIFQLEVFDFLNIEFPTITVTSQKFCSWCFCYEWPWRHLRPKMVLFFFFLFFFFFLSGNLSWLHNFFFIVSIALI